MRFRAQTLLERRRLAEEAAVKEVARTATERSRAESDQERLDAQAAAAQAQRDGVRSLAAGRALISVAEGQANDRFRARLAEAAEAAAMRGKAHREGPLAATLAAEAAARAQHDKARQRRETLERLKARADAADRKEAESRGEHAAGEAAATSGWRRQ